MQTELISKITIRRRTRLNSAVFLISCFFKIPHDTVERASDLHVKATKKYTGFDAAAA